MNPRYIAVAASIAALMLAVAPTALAGKGGSHNTGGGGTSGTSSISLAPIVSDANANGLPNYGDIVAFNVATTATTSPYVDLQCFQNGVLVGEGSRGYFDGALGTRNFGLSGPEWSGGAADCTAYLQMSTRQGMSQLASTSFHVAA
jgi:hypothetical protein